MSEHTISQPTLDHIVILVSHTALLELPARLERSLIVVDGGTHAGGLTSNKLILFQDGVYIELIAFADGLEPETRRKHRWGRLEEGRIIDWAYTLPHASDFDAVQRRVRDARTGIVYDDPMPGGRTRPDGTVLKWATASGRHVDGDATRPGQLPFWCLDKTERKLRVPYQDNPQTQHPAGARGVSQLSVTVPEEQLGAVSRVYDAIHGLAASGNSRHFPFQVPSGSTDGQQHISLSTGSSTAEIRLTLLSTQESPSRIEILPGLVLEVESASH